MPLIPRTLEITIRQTRQRGCRLASRHVRVGTPAFPTPFCAGVFVAPRAAEIHAFLVGHGVFGVEGAGEGASAGVCYAAFFGGTAEEGEAF